MDSDWPDPETETAFFNAVEGIIRALPMDQIEELIANPEVGYASGMPAADVDRILVIAKEVQEERREEL